MRNLSLLEIWVTLRVLKNDKILTKKREILNNEKSKGILEMWVLKKMVKYDLKIETTKTAPERIFVYYT